MSVAHGLAHTRYSTFRQRFGFCVGILESGGRNFHSRQEQNPKTRSEEGRYFGEIGNIYNLTARGVI